MADRRDAQVLREIGEGIRDEVGHLSKDCEFRQPLLHMADRLEGGSRTAERDAEREPAPEGGLTEEELDALEDEAIAEVASVALHHANRLPKRSLKRPLLKRIADLRLSLDQGMPEVGEVDRLDRARVALNDAARCEGLPAHAQAALRVAVELLEHYIARPESWAAAAPPTLPEQQRERKKIIRLACFRSFLKGARV